jgi:hypothetical protein
VNKRCFIRNGALAVMLAFSTVGGAPLGAQEKHEHDHDAHEHHEPKFGGVVEEAGGLDFELVAKPGVVRLYLDGHNKKVSAKGSKATVTFLRGSESVKMILLPAGENWLEAKGNAPTGKGVRVMALVLHKGKSISVRFAL